MLLIATASGGRGCRSRWWGYVEDIHPRFPRTVLKNFNRRLIPLQLNRTSVLPLNSDRTTPLSGRPHLSASRSYTVRRILIGRDEMVAEMHFLEQVCIMFLDSLPTVKRTLFC